MQRAVAANRFERIRCLGEGGMGIVYEARDLKNGGRVALKTLRRFSAGGLLRFKREFRALQGLQHPNLVTYGELMSDGDEWFFTMELVEGNDFLSYVRPGVARWQQADRSRQTSVDEPRRQERENAATEPRLSIAPPALDDTFDERRLRDALHQLADGLDALHASGLVHRDIKPSNIRVTDDGRVVLLDFGVVGELSGGISATAQGIVGTPSYMAPEQATGAPIGPEADWYSLGVLLYEALTGELPFSGPALDVLVEKQGSHPSPPSSRRALVPPDLDELCSALLRYDAPARPTGRDVLRACGVSEMRKRAEPSRALETVFVGRDRETERLRDALASSRKGTVSVLIAGESGVGKTSLVREFTEAIRAEHVDALVLEGRCYARESVPYRAFDGVVDALTLALMRMGEAAIKPILPEALAPLVQLFPVLARVALVERLARKQPQEAEPHEVRTRAFAALRELFTRLAAHRPVVIVMDDAQWADDDGLLLVSETLRAPGSPRVLLLATVRDVATEPGEPMARDRVAAALPGDLRRFELLPLSDAEGAELATRLLERAGRASSDEAQAIARDAAGNPLFIETLAAHDGAGAALAGAPRLEDAIWARVQALDPGSRQVVETLSVTGAPIAQEVLRRALPLVPEFLRCIGVLLATRIVQTVSPRDNDAVALYHDRIRAAVAGRLGADERRAIHHRLANALEATPDASTEALVHWLGAGDTHMAAACAVRAADAAAAVLAFERAAALYRMALELERPEGEQAVLLREKLGDALGNAGRGREAARAYLGAAARDSSTRSLDLRRRAAERLFCSGRIEEGDVILGSVLQAVGLRSPQTPLGNLLSLVACTLYLTIRGMKFHPRPGPRDSRDVLRVDCLLTAGQIGMSDHLRGSRFLARGLVEALALGEPARIARTLAFYAASQTAKGEPMFERSMASSALVTTMAHECGQPHLEAYSQVVAGFAHHLTGRWREARTLFKEAEENLATRCVGVAYELASMRVFLFREMFYAGELDDLIPRLAIRMREAEQREDGYAQMNFRSNATVYLALARDDVPAATGDLRWIEQHLPDKGFHLQHVHYLMALGHTLLFEGRARAARAAFEAQQRALRRSLLMRVQAIRVNYRELRGRVCLALLAAGPARSVRTELLRLVRGLEREQITWAGAHAEMLRGCLARLDRQRDRALAHFAAAEAGFERSGMDLLVRVAQAARGGVMAGLKGEALTKGAQAWLLGRGFREPARICALYAPGIPGVGTEDDDS
ncbi:MAG TPA: AAA family ATPase [Polyangiaceae bacterium]|jgi:serine/threonine protein kinase/tetratricopeptide (TPR) repeat protein